MKSKIYFFIVSALVVVLMFCACKDKKKDDIKTPATMGPTVQVIDATPIPGLDSSTKPSSGTPSTGAPSADETKLPDYVVTPEGTPTMRTSKPSVKPTVAPTINVQDATAIPNVDSSTKPSSSTTSTSAPGGDSTPTETPTEDPYDGFYNVMSSALYVEEKISDDVKICYPKLKNENLSVDPYVAFASGKSAEGDEKYMLEFLGNTYILSEKPESVMMYWSVMNLNDDGYYHIDNLYILVDDSYIVFAENITTPKLPGRGFINSEK
ncbi:MAG: hypothetical protein J6A50_06720 [Clostridia bacterium]|nr:hypothetical protein [Clostridia bacterium]